MLSHVLKLWVVKRGLLEGGCTRLCSMTLWQIHTVCVSYGQDADVRAVAQLKAHIPSRASTDADGSKYEAARRDGRTLSALQRRISVNRAELRRPLQPASARPATMQVPAELPTAKQNADGVMMPPFFPVTAGQSVTAHGSDEVLVQVAQVSAEDERKMTASLVEALDGGKLPRCKPTKTECGPMAIGGTRFARIDGTMEP